MERKMADNKKKASAILEKVGGKENIEFLVHCMTRLRFNLKDQSLAKQSEIEAIPGVLGTMIQNGQFQVIIGEMKTWMEGKKENLVSACCSRLSAVFLHRWLRHLPVPVC